jgi:hypothetical protein
MSKKYAIKLPFPGRCDIFGMGIVELHRLPDETLDRIHSEKLAEPYLELAKDPPASIRSLNLQKPPKQPKRPIRKVNR